jgi:hypothetical protein
VACSSLHLIHVHYIWGNVPNVAMCLHMAGDHPIRRLLHVHYFRSANTMLNSEQTLIPEQGLVHRCTAFTYEGLCAFLGDSVKTFTYTPFQAELTVHTLCELCVAMLKYPTVMRCDNVCLNNV